MSEENGSGDIDLPIEAVEEAPIEAITEESAPIEAASGETVEDAVEEAIEEGASAEEIKEIIETFKFKANGQDKEVTLDWNNKEDIIRRLQMAEAAQPAMQRASELEKNFERSIQELMDNPWETLSELGLDPDALAEARIQQKIEELQKSPDQLAQEARDAELEELRQKLKSQEEEKEAIEIQQLQQAAEVDLDNEITEALSSTTELPKSPYVVKRIADAMMSAMKNGHDDVSAKDVLPWVEKEINEEMQQLFSAMPDKVLEKYIGSKAIDRLRQGRLAKMQTQPIGKIKETGNSTPAPIKTKKNIKMADWLRHGTSINDFE